MTPESDLGSVRDRNVFVVNNLDSSQEAVILISAVTSEMSNFRSEIVGETAMKSLKNSMNILMKDSEQEKASKKGWDDFFQEFKESMREHILGHNKITQEVEKVLLITPRRIHMIPLLRNSHALYLLFYVLKYQGSYTDLGRNGVHERNMSMCSWYPVKNLQNQVVIAICSEILELHVNRLIFALNQKSRKKQQEQKIMDVYQAKCLGCTDLLRNLSEPGNNVSRRTKFALKSAFGSITRPQIIYLSASTLMEMTMEIQKQRDEYGITGFPLGLEQDINPSLDFFKEVNKIPLETTTEQKSKKRKSRKSDLNHDEHQDQWPTLRHFKDYKGSMDESLDQFFEIYAPLSVYDEMYKCLAFKDFFRTDVFRLWMEDIMPEMDLKDRNQIGRFLATDVTTDLHILPHWKISDRKIQSWIAEIAYKLDLSPQTIINEWTLRKEIPDLLQWCQKAKRKEVEEQQES